MDLLAFARSDDSPFAQYLEHIVNGGLARYRSIHQTGAREGQTLYTHVTNGVLVLEGLRECVGLSDIESRLLFAAYSVHDINKVANAQGEHGGYNYLATPERFATELAVLGMDRFFPAWREYLRDIWFLARAHQGHLAVVADGLNVNRAGQFRLGLDRLKRLGPLMEAVDCLDLSTNLSEVRNKEKFLACVNQASSERRWAWTWHRLAENRGILTNVIHNALVGIMRDRFDAVPLLYYPDGVMYLVPAETQLAWTDSDVVTAAGAVAASLARLQREDLAKFITPTKDGIKVAPQAFGSGAALAEILDLVVARVDGKAYSDKDIETYQGNILETDLRPKLDRVEGEAKVLLDRLLAEPSRLLARDADVLHRGELALAYKLLLAEYAREREVRADPWPRIYEVFRVPPPVRALADLVNSVRRGRFLARWLEQPLDAYIGRVAADAADQITPAGSASSEGTGNDALQAYLRAYLDLPFAERRGRRLADALAVYVRQRHGQCCHCGSLGQAGAWMAADVPPSVGVQSFSNRLPGGVAREPKRNVCEVCRIQYTLEKLAWVNHANKQGGSSRRGGRKVPGLRTFYLHLFPRAFFTQPFLVTWWRMAERLAREDHTAFLINADTYFREWQDGGPERVPIFPTKVNGVALPRLAETIGTVPVLPVHSPGDTYGEQFVLAVGTALVLGRFFDCRVVVSRLPVPPTTPGPGVELYIEGIPSALRGLIPQESLEAAEADRLFAHFRLLHLARAELVRGDKDPPPVVLELACAAADDPLRPYYVADRLIERRQRNAGAGDSAWLGIRTAQHLGPLLEELATGTGRK